MLVLVIGDLHIPFRAADLPLKFRKLLVPGKIQQIICTGNVCDRQTYEYLRSLGNEIHIVKGDYDENRHLPSSMVLQYPPVRIGVIHGHQIIPAADVTALSLTAQSMDVDILLHGHTHKFEAYKKDGRFFLNPGSATGAWTTEIPLSGDIHEKDVKGSESGQPHAKEDKIAAKSNNNKSSISARSSHARDIQMGSIPSFTRTYANRQLTPVLDIQGPVVVIYIYQLIEGDVKVEKIEYRKPTSSD